MLYFLSKFNDCRLAWEFKSILKPSYSVYILTRLYWKVELLFLCFFFSVNPFRMLFLLCLGVSIFQILPITLSDLLILSFSSLTEEYSDKLLDFSEYKWLLGLSILFFLFERNNSASRTL